MKPSLLAQKQGPGRCHPPTQAKPAHSRGWGHGLQPVAGLGTRARGLDSLGSHHACRSLGRPLPCCSVELTSVTPPNTVTPECLGVTCQGMLGSQGVCQLWRAWEAGGAGAFSPGMEAPHWWHQGPNLGKQSFPQGDAHLSGRDRCVASGTFCLAPWLSHRVKQNAFQSLCRCFDVSSVVLWPRVCRDLFLLQGASEGQSDLWGGGGGQCSGPGSGPGSKVGQCWSLRFRLTPGFPGTNP